MKKEEFISKFGKWVDKALCIFFNAIIICMVYEMTNFEFTALFALVAILSKLDRK